MTRLLTREFVLGCVSVFPPVVIPAGVGIALAGR